MTKKDQVDINFTKWIGFWGGFSILLTIISLVLIFTKGLNYGIDFSGGTEIQVKFTDVVSIDQVRSFTKEIGFSDAVVQQFSGESNEYLIRVQVRQGATEKETNEILLKTIESTKNAIMAKWPTAEIRRIDTVGPQVGSQLKRNGVLAAFYSILCILIYVGLRFDYKFAPGAVICLFHDAVVTLGVFSLLQKEVNIQIMAAVLTIIGYSLNDTIIIFDRIRESLASFKGRPIKDVINRSINDMLNRTILTSFTTLLATLCLYLYAGGVIEDFAFAMLIGIILGTYSSIYVASPFIIILDKFKR
ncbi:MAG: protein translocase subunit SecF [Oligoflexia bacterium]|nr:protein translocase subunit SecF [Oligoflexia bacterium]